MGDPQRGKRISPFLRFLSAFSFRKQDL